MKTQYISHLIIFFAIVSYCGCVTPMGMAPSSTPLHNKVVVEELGYSEGSDWTWSLLGLWSMGKPDIEKAINQAIAQKGGDALINVRWYQKHYYCVLFSITKVIVTGTVIKTAPMPTFEQPKKR